MNVADLDGDGRIELIVAADDQQALNQYIWNDTRKQLNQATVGYLAEDTITWNVTVGPCCLKRSP